MLVTIIIFIVILGLLIFVHEFGHFIVAKSTGMAIEEFGFGFPPRIFGIQRKKDNSWRIIKGTKIPDDSEKSVIYSINWLPIGGFVKIKGEQGDKRNEKDSFASKKIWQRAIVLSAGVGMNFITAFIILSIALSMGLPTVIDGTLPEYARVDEIRLQIIEVEKDSPADQSNIVMGDIIKSVDNQSVSTVEEFQTYVSLKKDQPTQIKILRGDEVIDTEVTPQVLDETDKGKVGIWLAETAMVSYPWYHAIWIGAKTTATLTWRILEAFLGILKNLVISQKVGVEIAGPVGIAVLTGQMAKMGFVYILQFTALLSVNLAIINFLPFPALDGGRVLFLIIEKIKGSPINQKIEALIHNVGFLILIGLVLLVTFWDIARSSEMIKGVLSNIF